MLAFFIIFLLSFQLDKWGGKGKGVEMDRGERRVGEEVGGRGREEEEEEEGGELEKFSDDIRRNDIRIPTHKHTHTTLTHTTYKVPLSLSGDGPEFRKRNVRR